MIIDGTAEQKAALFVALAGAQKAIRGAGKDSKNPHFRTTYASLAAVIDAVRLPLAEHGIARLQGVEVEGHEVVVTTTLAHVEGGTVSSVLRAPVGKGGPQGIGSAATYARRYSLMGLVGLAPVDDDAEEAEGRGSIRGSQDQSGGARTPTPPFVRTGQDATLARMSTGARPVTPMPSTPSTADEKRRVWSAVKADTEKARATLRRRFFAAGTDHGLANLDDDARHALQATVLGFERFGAATDRDIAAATYRYRSGGDDLETTIGNAIKQQETP